MNTVNRVLRKRKPLADRSNTVIASPSSLSSSSSSKPLLSHSKRFNKPSLLDAKKPRTNSIDPATPPSVIHFDITTNPTNLRPHRSNTTRPGKISSRSGDQRHVLEKPKDKGMAFPLPAEPINARYAASPLQPEYLIDIGEPDTKSSEKMSTEKIKDKGKAILRYDPIAVVRDPSSSSQEQFEYVQNLGPCGSVGMRSSTVNTPKEARKKNVDVPLPFSCPRSEMLQTAPKNGDKLNAPVGESVIAKSFTVPHPRPKKEKGSVVNDYIERQKAYFAEIDAFELAVSYSDPEE